LLKNRILIVDDEPDIAQVLKMGLEDNGFTNLDAISNFEVGSYDLLLIDIKMPTMNGFELYNKLHQIDEKAKIRFITAYELIMTNLRKYLLK
jgi:DNA-binding response OmpR family regulator